VRRIDEAKIKLDPPVASTIFDDQFPQYRRRDWLPEMVRIHEALAPGLLRHPDVASDETRPYLLLLVRLHSNKSPLREASRMLEGIAVLVTQADEA